MEWLYPAGGAVGSKFVLTTGGSAEPWPVKAWCDNPAVTILAQTNKNKFDVTIATNASPGFRQVRLWNNDGASAPRAFSIGLMGEIEEKDPNNNFKQATNVLALPVLVNGKFEKANDNDTFAVDLSAGKTFAARMEAYRLGSMMDPVLHLFDSAGKRVAFSHDSGTLDPFLTFTPANSGRFYVQVMAFNHPASVNVNFHGNAAAVYRLHLTQDVFAESAWPLAVQRGSTNNLLLRGPNLPNSIQVPSIPSGSLSPGERAGVRAGLVYGKGGLQKTTSSPIEFLFPEGFSNSVPILFGEGLPIVEKEPNNATNEAQKITLPLSISGTVSSEDRLDRFAFDAKKDDQLVITIWSARLGSGLDCVLKVLDEKNSELARSNIQTEERDPTLNWKAPRDGTFFATVSDLRSGKYKEGIYHLFIESFKPSFAPTVDAHSFQLESGKTNEIPLKVARKNFEAKLLCSIDGLPKEALLLTTEIPEKAAGPLKIFVPASITNWAGAIQITLSSTNSHSEKATFNLQGDDGEHAGRWFIPETSHLWLNIVPAK